MIEASVMEEVKERGDVGAIVAYHPVIFRGLKKLTCQEGSKERSLLECVASGISIFCPHTSLDACRDGINDWLISGVVEKGTKTWPISPTDKQEGCDTGMGRMAALETSVDLETLVERVKAHLKLSHVRVAFGDDQLKMKQKIESVGVCAGSGSSLLVPVAERNRLLLSGEMSHHDVLAATASGSSVILCEHTNTERGYLSVVLQRQLQSRFDAEKSMPKVNVVVSQRDQDPLHIY
eukprot:Partr_v1_DN24949_c0_g2_i1_m45364 putative NIF3 NGG1 interacting factor 3-like 1 (S. cerevisiae)